MITFRCILTSKATVSSSISSSSGLTVEPFFATPWATYDLAGAGGTASPALLRSLCRGASAVFWVSFDFAGSIVFSIEDADTVLCGATLGALVFWSIGSGAGAVVVTIAGAPSAVRGMNQLRAGATDSRGTHNKRMILAALRKLRIYSQ